MCALPENRSSRGEAKAMTWYSMTSAPCDGSQVRLMMKDGSKYYGWFYRGTWCVGEFTHIAAVAWSPL